MIENRIDALARALGAIADRRTAARALTAGSLGLLALLAGHDAEAKKKKKGKKKNKKKPSQCKPNQETCGNACCNADQPCIAGQCLGACQFTVDNDLKTMTLQANCATTETILIADQFTLEGDGKTIHLAGPIAGYLEVTVAQSVVRAGLLIQNGTGLVKNVTIDQDALQCAAGLRQSAIVMANGRGNVEGITIALTKDDQNCYRSGISAQVAANNDAINIRNVTITGNRFSGIALSGPANGGEAVVGEIDNCTISGPGFGMVLTDSKHSVTDNIVTAGIGITVGSFPSDVFIDGNTITGLSGATNFFGVNVGGDADGTVTDNAISGFTCGIAIQTDAGDVAHSGNTFPAPGNTTDICDSP